MKKKRNNLLDIFPRPIAHRGLHDEVSPENSLGAFEKAVIHNFEIELDIMLSQDEEVIVFHDDDLLRMCGVKKRIKDCSLEELKTYRLLKTKEVIPTLKEVLNVVDGKSSILVEFKVGHNFSETLIDKTLAILKDYSYPHRIALQSFNPYILKALRRKSKTYLIGQLSTGNLQGETKRNKFLFKTLLVNLISKPDFISFEVDFLHLASVKRAKRWGYPILSWTIDNQKRYEIALKNSHNYIFDNVITFK